MKARCNFILALVGGCSAALAAAVLLLQSRAGLTVFLFGRLGTDQIGAVLLVFAAVAFTVLLVRVLLHCSNTKPLRWLWAALAVFAVLGGLFCLLGALLFGYADSPRYITWQDPDAAHTLVVEESSFLLSGHGTFYQKVSPFLMRKVGSYSADDGYRPFSNGSYALTWQQGGLLVEYNNGTGYREPGHESDPYNDRVQLQYLPETA